MLTNKQLDSLFDVLTRKKLEDFDSYGRSLSFDKEAPTLFEWKEHGKYFGEKYIYIRTSPNSKVLAVGHCDYVKFTSNPKINRLRDRVFAGQLDDRLGVWLLLHILPELLPKDLPYDILLTDNEESSASTAAFFFPPEGLQYNWMFEWDRRGSDVVMYDYETPELKALLATYDFEVGVGSFTDIGFLAHLGCAGFNFGTGYHGEHTDGSYADLYTTHQNLSKFKAFYTRQYGVRLEYNQKRALERRNGRVGSHIGRNFSDDKLELHTPRDVSGDDLSDTELEDERSAELWVRNYREKYGLTEDEKSILISQDASWSKKNLT